MRTRSRSASDEQDGEACRPRPRARRRRESRQQREPAKRTSFGAWSPLGLRQEFICTRRKSAVASLTAYRLLLTGSHASGRARPERYSRSGSRKWRMGRPVSARTFRCRERSRPAAERAARRRRRSESTATSARPDSARSRGRIRTTTPRRDWRSGRCPPPPVEQRGERLRKVGSWRRAAALIRHDGQAALPVVDLLADGLDEIPPGPAEEPGGAHHERGGQAQRGFLALALGEAVGGERRRGIVLLIRQALRAVEDEVRGHLQESRPWIAHWSASSRRPRVDLEGARVGLAGVHLRERRAVDDDLRPRCRGRPAPRPPRS